ncbi:hypothetical protein JRO89_XS03G0194800 [Xanthoceras sorbifolium]|uniref:Ankyrin repeat-containing protein BDA1-like n=1 Tax=Xanthoceras sorbifolium TaxID=99658 RepID=A0ABQ8IAM4_9ROSI|nr:hypothetical protein JRO89_XS03G0194800 [Xanthoceras sorbifolium]
MVAVNTFISLEFIEADIQEASNVNILGIFHHRREGCSRHEEIDVGASSSQALQNQSNATLELNSPTLHLLSGCTNGDWKKARCLLSDYGQLLLRTAITEADETALHIATEQDKVLLSLLTPEDRADVFFRSIKNDLYGIALKFLKEHPGLVLAHDMDGDTALHVLARKSLYMSEMKLNRNLELKSLQALQLLECLWKEATRQSSVNIKELIPSNLLFDAVKMGNFPFLVKLIRFSPTLVHKLDENKRTIFHIAILHRHINIFNLIHEIGFNKELIATYVDDEKNTLLHLAAKYPDQPSVGGLPAAAPNFQRELIIFKVILSHSLLSSIFFYYCR